MFVFYSLCQIFLLASCVKIEHLSICERIEERFSVTCNFRVHGTGFHRNLEMEIRATSRDTTIDENALIRLTLPPSTFLDPYQPSMLEGSATFRALLPALVDVEATKERATSIPVLLYSPLNFSEREANVRLSLPIHIRYHQPSASSYVSFRLPRPTLHVRVQFDSGFLAPCDHRNLSACHFCHLPMSANSSDVVVEVPVGRVEHTVFVSWVTAIVVLIGFLHLTLTLKNA